jgi:hypothetical protein
MPSVPVPRPPGAVILAGVLFALLGGLVPPAARASTIYACVKPRSGATRIVGAKARCRHGEKRMSWSTTGPREPVGAAGAPGAPGGPGAEGKPGVASAYSIFTSESAQVATGKESLLIAKTIPPGSYVAFFKTNLVAEAETPGFVEAACLLGYRPGTATTGEATDIDLSAWTAALAPKEAKDFQAISPIAMQAAFTTKVTVTLAAGCLSFAGAVNPHSAYAQLQAVGVSSIG